jgi:hypothetical protein
MTTTSASSFGFLSKEQEEKIGIQNMSAEPFTHAYNIAI